MKQWISQQVKSQLSGIGADGVAIYGHGNEARYFSKISSRRVDRRRKTNISAPVLITL